MDLNQISADTLETITKSLSAGVNSSTGITGIDLSDVISLVPVNTPFYDSLAKTKPKMGAKFAEWKALLNVNNSQPDPSVPFDFAAPLALLDEVDVSAKYARTGFGYTVTQDSIDLAGGYADAKAIAIFNSLNQYKIGMDKKLLGGQSFALATPSGVVVTPSNTGGSIAASTAVSVQVAARTASNYFYGGSTVASNAVSVNTAAGTATNSAVATCAAVPGAVAYDWFVGGYYLTTTTVNKLAITSIPGANQSVPNLPNLYSVAPTVVPTIDASAKPNDYNGLLATLTGDYATGGAFGQVQHGTGTPSGAQLISLDGNPFSVNGQSVHELDELNSAIWNAVTLSPDSYLMSSDMATAISTAILSTAGGGTTFYAPNEAGQRQGAIAGAFIGYYVNKAAGGKPIALDVQPNLPNGTVIARTNSVPFPNSNITNVLEQRDVAPIADYEYAAARLPGVAGGGPRYDGETYSLSTLVNRAPVAMGVISNVAIS